MEGSIIQAKVYAEASAKVIAGQMSRTALPSEEPGEPRFPEPQVQQQTMAAIQAMVEQMQSGFAQLAAAISQPLIPQRGADGLIETVIRGRPN